MQYLLLKDLTSLLETLMKTFPSYIAHMAAFVVEPAEAQARDRTGNARVGMGTLPETAEDVQQLAPAQVGADDNTFRTPTYTSYFLSFPLLWLVISCPCQYCCLSNLVTLTGCCREIRTPKVLTCYLK